MEVFEAVRTVLAVRQYADRPVPPEVVDRIVEAARLTGSSMNAQPWHFIVVDRREQLRQLSERTPSGPYVAEAALAVAVAVERDSIYGVSDGSRAIQSMMLTAWEQGVGSNWVGFRPMDGVAELLGVPDHLEVLAVVPFGYPARPGSRGQKRRKPRNEVVHHGRFGQPFE